MSAADLRLARDRTRNKPAFAAHAANLRCSKINRTVPEYVEAYTLGERRRRSALALDRAAYYRRAAKRALRHLRLTIAWANRVRLDCNRCDGTGRDWTGHPCVACGG